MVKRGRRWSTRNDMPPPAGFHLINDYNLADKFGEFITDDAKIPALRKKFEEYIGPVKGEAFR